MTYTMRINAHPAFAFLLALAAPCNAQRSDSLHPPKQLLRYKLDQIRPSANAGEGTQYRYTADNGRVIDIFIYPAPDSSDRTALVEHEAASFVEWLRSGGARPAFELDSVVTQASTSASAHDTLFVPGYLVVALLIRRREEQFLTYFHVLLIREWFVKARATMPREGHEATFDEVLTFTREIMIFLLAGRE